MIDIKTKQKIKAQVFVPGSKSLTQRALVVSSLADGESLLEGALVSEDIDLIIDGLKSFGAEITTDADRIRVTGTGGHVRTPRRPLYMGNNGTGIRFLTALSTLSQGPVTLTGSPRMQERPMQDLLDALKDLGANVISINGTGCPPVKISSDSGELKGGHIRIKGGVSSQFVSAILLAAPYAQERVFLEIVDEPVSTPYISMTLKVMKDFGIPVDSTDKRLFSIPQGRYVSRVYGIEGDASNASYFWAAAAVTGGEVCVRNLFADSVQGDIAFLNILEQMGCRVERSQKGISVIGPEELRGVTVNMKEWPDIVPTLAVVAAYAEGETFITNVSHLRIKETDRLHAVAVELAKIGAEVDEFPDALRVRKGISRPAVIDTYNDHRMAMSFSVAGLMTPGISISNEECVSKSFPNFWDVFEKLYE